MAAAATVLPTRPAGAATGTAPRDEYSEFALAVQTSADKAVQSIKRKTELQGMTWALPLSAAPSAVSTMAILFKTASAKAAAGLPVTSHDIKDGTGKVLGQLQYKYLHTNLQACSDVGSSAFAEARKVMSSINRVAAGMTEDNGNIEFVIKLLDNREEAQRHLISELDTIRSSAKGCLDDINHLTDRFHYWHAFINCLRQNARECKGTTQKAANAKEDEQKKTETEMNRYKLEEEIAANKVQELQRQLEEQKKAVADAQEYVNKVQNLSPITVPDDTQLRLRANKEITAAQKKKGFGGALKDAFFGESDDEVAARQARERDVERRREEFINNERARREEERKRAADRLREAREYEVKLRASITEAAEKLAESQTQRGEASANLVRTQGHLKRLADDKIELEDILDILKESTVQLGELKKQVDKLVRFFEVILQDVQITVDKDIEDFFRPIENGIRVHYRTNALDSVELSWDGKQRVINKALHIQGGFSTVREVTAAYVAVSDSYIQPAIERMDELAELEGDEWATESREFSDWCNSSIADIKKLAQEASQKAETNMTERIQHLRRRAVEAAPQSKA